MKSMLRRALEAETPETELIQVTQSDKLYIKFFSELSQRVAKDSHYIEAVGVDDLTQALGKESVVAFIILSEDKRKAIAAVINSISDKDSYLHIGNLMVDKDYRGNGLSIRLLDHSREKARELRLKYLTIGVDVSNTRAHSIYKEYGFEKDSEVEHMSMSV